MIKISSQKIEKCDDLEKIRNDWEKLENGKDMTVFQSYQWNVLLYKEWDNFGLENKFSKIEICTVHEDGEIKVILPIIVQRRTTKLKCFGRKKGIYVLGYGSYSDYINLIYDKFDKCWVDELFEYLKKKYSGYMFIINDVREGTEFFEYCSMCGYEHITSDVAVFIKVEKSVNEYNSLISKHTRQNLRTALNRMKKRNMDYRVSVRGVVEDEKLLNELLDIHIQRMKTKIQLNQGLKNKLVSYVKYKRKEYIEKNNNIVYQSMKLLQNSCLVLVELNGEVVGYLYGLKDKGFIRILQNCFNEEYKFYSPLFRGAYDFICMCYENKGMEGVDFTRGDEEYKYKLGGVEINLHEYRIVL